MMHSVFVATLVVVVLVQSIEAYPASLENAKIVQLAVNRNERSGQNSVNNLPFVGNGQQIDSAVPLLNPWDGKYLYFPGRVGKGN